MLSLFVGFVMLQLQDKEGDYSEMEKWLEQNPSVSVIQTV